MLKQSEESWQKQVIELLHTYGWTVCEFKKARQMKHGEDTYRTPFGADGRGFPDLVAVRPPRLAFIENKSNEGHLSREQMNWNNLLGHTDAECYILRPRDWDIIVKAFE